MNETKRIDPSELDGKEPIATGYKIFSWDWTGYGGYCYADENGDVEGSVHTVTGELSKCGWGLHYCENPVDCMRYRDLIQWNKFALVEAYDENIKADNDNKSVCRTLKIKKVLSFDDMIKACKNYQINGYGISDGSGISGSSGISYGYGISGSSGISDGSGISGSSGISYGYGISGSSGISYGYGISGSSGIGNGCGISNGYGISYGYGISGSSGISYGYGISNGYGISYGYGISDGSGISYGCGISNGYGIRSSSGVNQSMHCHKCEGISRCLFCYDIEGARLMLFNKPIKEDRFNEVYRELGSWYPNFTNAEELKAKHGDGKWKSTPAPAISGRTTKEAYAEVPDDLRKYIQSLPEYDEEIFKKITGEADDE